MNFEKYMSLKRIDTQEVEGITNGVCHVFPKLDGTNASVWLSEEKKVMAGSRNRELDETSQGDNGGFCKWVRQQENIKNFLNDFSHIRLFGEWLIPHSLKTYQEDAWRRFYVFDVYDHKLEKFMPYDAYKTLLEKYKIDYIPILCKINNPTFDELLKISKDNKFLVVTGIGEGVVVKNYDYKNRYNRVVWAKIVTDEFKVKHKQEFKSGREGEEKKTTEKEIVDKFCTEAFIVKEYNKFLLNLKNEGKEWESKYIGQILGMIYWEFIREESYEFIKKHKSSSINLRQLNILVTKKIKETLKEIF